jgi:hypothetical protein
VGNNGAWTSMHGTVVELYDAGCLDRRTLDVVLGVYRGMDIDQGGYIEDFLSEDGLTLEQIAWKVYHPDEPLPPDLPEEEQDWFTGPVEEFWSDLREKMEWI